MASVSFKGEEVIWGTRELGTPVNGGICVNGGVDNDGANDRTDNEDGQRIGIIFFDEDWSGDIDVVCKKSCSNPKIGDEVTVDGKRLFVQHVKKTWANKSKKQLKITLIGGANIK